jgi:tripartite-type tricarboxylate transporter receptor subunit TctC
MRRDSWLCALALVAAFVPSAQAQQFPSKPISFVIPYQPGGNVDVAARIVQKAIGDGLGQPILIENKPGGAAMLAGDHVARSDPDGHTLLVGSNGPVVYGSLTLPNPPYHWATAFAPVSSVSSSGTVLVVRPSLPIHTVKEMIEYVKANPDKFSLATGGASSINHMASELLQLRANVKWSQIHYRGNAPALNDLIGGHVDAGFGQLSDSFPLIQSGKLRAIAVLGNRRMAVLPDVPTMEEAGYTGIEAENFVGVLAPKKTPKAVVDKLSTAIREAVAQKSVVEQFAAIGTEARGSTPEEFTRFLQDETTRWTEVVQKANIRVSN